MKILYVVSRPLEINTSASIRNCATINGLLQNGHQVTLVSSQPDKNHLAYDSSLQLNSVEKKYFNLRGTQSVASMGRKFECLNVLKPVIYKLLYGNQIYDNLKDIVNYVDQINIEDYDIVISSSDPKSSHLFVDKLFEKNKKKIPWIQIWGDPFADDITIRKKQVAKIMQEEKRLLGFADKIVYVSDMTCSSQKKKFAESASKMHYVPIPYLKPRISNKQFPNNYKDVKLCYCGDYGSHIRNLVPVYEAAKELGMQLRICGMSNLKLEQTQEISVLARQNASVVCKMEEEADVLVHLSNRKGTQIPGKIYQYISTNKTVLFILDGDIDCLKNIFEPYGRFLFVENDERKIKETLINIVKLRQEISNEPLAYFNAKNISSMIIQPFARK